MKNKTKENKMEYPWITKLGLTIITSDRHSIPGIDEKELAEKLGKENSKIFDEFFGCQSCGGNGMYVYDVEAVLHRMFTGKLTGTQLFLD